MSRLIEPLYMNSRVCLLATTVCTEVIILVGQTSLIDANHIEFRDTLGVTVYPITCGLWVYVLNVSPMDFFTVIPVS